MGDAEFLDELLRELLVEIADKMSELFKCRLHDPQVWPVKKQKQRRRGRLQPGAGSLGGLPSQPDRHAQRHEGRPALPSRPERHRQQH